VTPEEVQSLGLRNGDGGGGGGGGERAGDRLRSTPVGNGKGGEGSRPQPASWAAWSCELFVLGCLPSSTARGPCITAVAAAGQKVCLLGQVLDGH
jgi:hypothetical protein